jgi:hypothetical protein
LLLINEAEPQVTVSRRGRTVAFHSLRPERRDENE